MGKITHGHTLGVNGKTVLSPTYMSWKDMLGRVDNHPRYKSKGISVCERWRAFENFLFDMGERPLGPTRFTIDRIDNDGGYEVSNCRWATFSEQRRNSGASSRVIEYGGEKTPYSVGKRKGNQPVNNKP